MAVDLAAHFGNGLKSRVWLFLDCDDEIPIKPDEIPAKSVDCESGYFSIYEFRNVRLSCAQKFFCFGLGEVAMFDDPVNEKC